MCTPSFMCKFPFSGREFFASGEAVPYAWPRTAEHWLDGQDGGAKPMRNGRRQSTTPIERLRLAIDCMPVATREAMLAGVRERERIIVGAYVDEHGGVCPMLAAHRCGGRTDFLSFAKSWDRFTRAKGGSRRASKREVRILITQLEDSVASATGLELDTAIKEHRELMSRRVRRRRRLPDAADPSGQIVARRQRRPWRGAGASERAGVSQRPSPGRTNIISGMMQAGEVLSR
jgi:hypothetical protein